MGNSFTVEEKRNFMFKKHLKDHLFEYVLDFVEPIVFTVILLYICKAENYLYGIVVAVAYSILRLVYSIVH